MNLSGRVPFRKGRVARRALATAGSLLCLALQQAPKAEAQTFEEPPTGAPASPPPPNSVDPGEVSVPPGSPAYLERTYLSALKAPLPAKIYDQGGIPPLVPRLEVDGNPHGGPMALSRATPAARFTGAPAFDEYDRWAGLPGGGDAQAAKRLSIGRPPGPPSSVGPPGNAARNRRECGKTHSRRDRERIA